MIISMRLILIFFKVALFTKKKKLLELNVYLFLRKQLN